MESSARRRPGRRTGRIIATTAAALTAGALVAIPQASAAGDGDGIVTGGPEGRSAEAIQLDRDHAAVSAAPLKFGAEPLKAVEANATAAAAAASCEISAKDAAALTLAPTWPEVSGGADAAPSPMTLSRYDNQQSLYDPKSRSGLFFNPGVGPWQLDSAGLGADNAANGAIDVNAASKKIAPYIVDKYCAAVKGGSSAAEARGKAWTDWHACDSGACEDTYKRALAGVTADKNVGRYGGASPRKCTYDGVSHDCLYVDPAKAQGADWWAKPDGGQSPVPKPFYVFTYKGDDGNWEIRWWLPEDSGQKTGVSVSRKYGADARGQLSWADENGGLCDTTENRGDC